MQGQGGQRTVGVRGGGSVLRERHEADRGARGPAARAGQAVEVPVAHLGPKDAVPSPPLGRHDRHDAHAVLLSTATCSRRWTERNVSRLPGLDSDHARRTCRRSTGRSRRWRPGSRRAGRPGPGTRAPACPTGSPIPGEDPRARPATRATRAAFKPPPPRQPPPRLRQR